MDDFRTRLADIASAPRCVDCGGAKVPVSGWLAMSAADVRAWTERLQAELARVDTLRPGDAMPTPLVCACPPDTLAEAARLQDAAEPTQAPS